MGTCCFLMVVNGFLVVCFIIGFLLDCNVVFMEYISLNGF